MLRRTRPCAAPRALGAGLALAVLLTPSLAQDEPLRGIRRVDPRWHALVHATLVPAPGERIEDATIVVRDGVVVSVEAGGAAPAGARVWDCAGRIVHAGLIEMHVEVEAPRVDPVTELDHWQHELITPQRSALDGAGLEASVREELRGLGFTAAAIAPGGGILAGTSAVVALGDEGTEVEAASELVVREGVYQMSAFRRRGFGGSGLRYPNSEMGAISLMRQTLLDADHHASVRAIAARGADGVEPPAPSRALEALDRSADLPLLFDAQNELQALRAARLADEFGRPMMILGSGSEYQRLDAVVDTGLPFVLPLDFPEAPDVSTQSKAEQHSLETLMAWEHAPSNPRRMAAAGVTVALTTARLGSRGDFPASLRRALDAGLDAEDALAMLTTVPARLLGVGDRLGRVAPGMLAHLVVLDGEPFAKDTKVHEVWVGGRRHEVTKPDGPDHSGVWSATFPVSGEAVAFTLTITEDGKVRVTVGDEKADTRNVELARHQLHLHLDGQALGVEGTLAVSGLFEGEVLHGSATGPDGAQVFWRAERTSTEVPEAEEGDAPDAEEDEPSPGEDPAPVNPDEAEPAAEPAEPVTGDDAPGEGQEVEAVDEAPQGRRSGGRRGRGEADDAPAGEPADEPVDDGGPARFALPFGAYGYDEVPAQRAVRVVGGTLWTGGPLGIVEDGVLVVDGGRVVYAGPADGAPATPDAEVIDASGKHVTPGLIDCHSHTGISGGVNESGERVTCEVRIADVIDPDDMSYYRQLAGGLTAANQLHGSANAIGGQNSVVKNRWGARHPDDLRLAGAPAGVKFALGENPKRVAARSDDPSEYPQTRMGVEALIRDRLVAGREYGERWARYRALSPWARERTLPPRRDLELEAMAEIVSGERLIHCHSYRQDEILMLARMAQEFGITIGTFQHVLEGYKVADAVAESALGASTFSDWWAYKFEVIDAIPHNAALMSEVGVVVSINSDSDEHARRLNTEAAKGVKYGGMDRHAALQMVTLNPAIQLGVADRVGSLEAGKDGDFVVWSGDPLSYASRCETTWIDGREYFSLERDRELRAAANAERQRLVQKLMAAEKSGGARGGAGRRGGRPGESLAGGRMTLREAYARGLMDELEALWRAGDDVDAAQRGECGCWDVYLFSDRAQAAGR